MNAERKDFLSVIRVTPARLDARETAWYLGFAAHDIPVLVSAGLLKPLGHPPANAVNTMRQSHWRSCVRIHSGSVARPMPWSNTGRTRTRARPMPKIATTVALPAPFQWTTFNCTDLNAGRQSSIQSR
jgi:hypothetical protein